MPFKSRITRLFTEASMMMGITPKSIKQTTNSLLGAIGEAFVTGDLNSILSQYENTNGREFSKLLKIFLESIYVIIKQRSEDYEVGLVEASKGFIKSLEFDVDDYIENSLNYDENFFNIFDESKLADFVEGFYDSIEEKEHYRALFFLASYMLKKRTDKDLMGGGITSKD